ncbi:hypothetical protein MRX96_017415 [Rhipicephalus microplus]
MAASNGRGVASPAVVASNASETKMQPAKKPRRCFSAHEDLCLLREVAAAKPFGDDIKWVHVLAAVKWAVGRELTLRGIKDHVDILLGYWKLQNSKPPNWRSTTTHKTTPPQQTRGRLRL